MKEKYDRNKQYKSLSEIDAGEPNLATFVILKNYRDALENYMHQQREEIHKEQQKLDENIDIHRSQKK